MGIDMRKAIRYTIAFFLSMEILSILAPSLPAKAQQVTLGVYPGESFIYGTPDGSPWVSMSPSIAPAPNAVWEKFMNLSTIAFNIINDSDPSAPNSRGYTFNEIVKFRNGTSPQIAVGTIDLETGAGLGLTFFIPPMLEEGDLIYPGNANSTWTINATRIDSMNWIGRRVCVLNYTIAPSNSSYAGIQRTVIYWDWDTGVLLGTWEEAAAVASSGASVSGVLLYELISNNIGIPMDYPSTLNLLPIYFAAAILAVAVVAIMIVQTATKGHKKKYKRLKE
jgi:hypothetical protein